MIQHSKQRGLTLIELLVVVVIMAVIAAVGYPMYTNQVAKTRRADAKVALETLALAQERYYTINGTYAGSLSSLQVSSDIQGGNSNEGYYTIAAPTLFLWAEAGFPARTGDPLSLWRAWAPGVTGQSIPGTGHFMPEEAPDATLSALQAFLRD